MNPVLGKAIVDIFPLTERGIAMGIKQMGLTLGGLLSALVAGGCGIILGALALWLTLPPWTNSATTPCPLKSPFASAWA